jgi:ferredoxin
MADNGKAEIVSQDIVDCTREAAEGCPVQAIKIE